MTRTDFYILQSLSDPEILNVQSPAIIAYNLDLSREHVSSRLSEFVDRGLVERESKGKYKITNKGEALVENE